MKILFLSTYFAPAWDLGGPVRSTWNLVRGLARLGVNITVLTTNVKQSGVVDVPRVRDEQGVHIITEDVVRRGRTTLIKKCGLAPRMMLDIGKYIGQNDIVHLNGFFGFHSVAAAAVAFKENRPLIISTRGGLNRWSLSQKRMKKTLFLHIFGKYVFSQADGIHFTVEDEKRQAPTWLVGERGFVVPNAVEFGPKGDPKRFRKKIGVKSDALLIGMVGRIHKVKGFDVILPGIAGCKRKDVVAVIIGPDEAGHKQCVDALIRENNLEKNVFFQGMLNGRDLEDAYAGMDVLAVPSYEENFGNVVAEAAAQGTPCMVSDQVGLKDWVSLNNIGFVLPLQSDLWTEALEGIRKDEMSKLWEPGRLSRCARESFSMERVAKLMLAQYESILREKGGAKKGR